MLSVIWLSVLAPQSYNNVRWNVVRVILHNIFLLTYLFSWFVWSQLIQNDVFFIHQIYFANFKTLFKGSMAEKWDKNNEFTLFFLTDK
jgi:hypothetical protein